MRISHDLRYTLTDEQLIAYSKVPLIDRLRWLNDLVCFTQAWRAAPDSPKPQTTTDDTSKPDSSAAAHDS
jgi:hypothetical protein